MAERGLPAVSTLPSLSATERTRILDLLFEPCVQLHTLSLELLGTSTFDSYNDLIAAIGVQLTQLAESTSASDTQWLESILGAHPRLGAKNVESEQSQAEQAQLNTGGAEEASQLTLLNIEYEGAFPCLRYVVFVDGRPRTEIMDNMKARIARGDIKLERAEAIRAMCDIASDRAAKIQAASI